MMAPTWAVADFPTWTPAAKQGPASMFEQQIEPEMGFAALMDAAPVAERTNSISASALQRTESVDKAVVCIVPGCAKDLHTAKQYYQQHRICEEHFKSSSFELGGILCRFCQQCARSHPLSEFDGLLRSCKEQLRKHRMRRKSRKSDTMEDTEPAKKVSCGSARDGDPAVLFRLGIDGRRCSSGEIVYTHANLTGNYYDDWPHAHSPQQLHMDGQAPPLSEWNLHTSLSGGSSGSYVHLSPRWTQQQLQHQQHQQQGQLGYDSNLGGYRPQHGQARQDNGGGPSRLNSEHRTFVTPNGRVHRHNSCSPLFASNSSTSMLLNQQPPLQGVMSGSHPTLRSQDEIAMCHDRWSVPEYLMQNSSLPMQQQAAPIFEQQQQRATVFDQQQPQQWKRQVQSGSYQRDSELQSSPFSYDMYMAAMQDGGDSREVTTSVVTTGIVTTAHPHSSSQQRIGSLPQLSVNTQHLSRNWSPQQHSPQEASQHQERVFDERMLEGSFRQGSPQGSQQQQRHAHELQHQACLQQNHAVYAQPQPSFEQLGRRPSNNENVDSRYPSNNEHSDSHMYEQQQQNSFQQDWQEQQYLELLQQPPHHLPTQTFATEQCPLDVSTDKDSDLAHAVLQWLPLTAQPEPQQPRPLPSSTFTFNTSLGTPTGSGELSTLNLAQTTSSSHWRPPTVETGGREKGHIFYRQQLQLNNSGERALRWGHPTSQIERAASDAETAPALHGMPPEQQRYTQQQQQEQEEGGELRNHPSHGQQASDGSHSTGTGVQPGSQPALGRMGIAVGSYHAMNSSINSRPVMSHSVFDTMSGGSRRDSDTPPNSGAWQCPIRKKSS